MAKQTLVTNLLGVRVKVKPGWGVHQHEEGEVRGVYTARADSVFGNVMVLVAKDDGELFDTYATAVYIVRPEEGLVDMTDEITARVVEQNKRAAGIMAQNKRATSKP